MEIDWTLKLILLAVLLASSAFFSGSEVALFSLDKRRVKHQFKNHVLIQRYVSSLINQPRRLLVTILVGNTIVNVAASIVAVTLAIEISPIIGISLEIGISVQIILLTIFILIFGEFLPKMIATNNPVSYAKIVTIFLYWISVLIYPVAEVLTELIKVASSKLNMKKVGSFLTKDEISDLSDISKEKGTLEEEEHEIIKSIVSFKNILSSEIMTPRVDIKSITLDMALNEIIEIINETGHSRFPLYKEDLDNISGILYAKDLLPYIKNGILNENLNLLSIVRKAIFVPKTKKIDDLLREFQKKKTHIAIVVDEYGGTAGLITLEDIIEEVVGEIWDEYDKEEDAIEKIDKDHYMVLGKTPIDELNEFIGFEVIPDDPDYETAGGLVLKHAGFIPKQGYNFIVGDYKFTVEEVHRKRIKKILIEKEMNSEEGMFS
ncbi:hemolysin family protein [Bacteroidota bacterium]